MNGFRTQNSLSPTRQTPRQLSLAARVRPQEGPQSWGPHGWGHWWAMLSLAACGGDDATPTAGTAPTTTVSVTNADNDLNNEALIYITPEGLLAGADLTKFGYSFELTGDGDEDTTSINLEDLDSSEVSIVTNSEGNQVFAIARSAVNEHAANSTNSASTEPISYSLRATSEIIIDQEDGVQQTISVGDVITENAVTIDPGLISVIAKLPDYQGNTTQLATTTVDLNEVFTSVSAISFSAVDDEGNAISLTDKNGDGIAAEFSLDELAASIDETATITVSARTADGIFVGQSFNVVVEQEVVNTPFVGNGRVVSIMNGSANSPSVIVIPLSGGDGEITYDFGDKNDSANISNLQGQILFSANASGTYLLTATDADGDSATITIEFIIPDTEVSVPNALPAQTHMGNVGEFTVALADVFESDSTLTLTSGDGTIAGGILTIDTENLVDGDHTFTVTATDEEGDIATNAFVLTVDKSPTIAITLQDETVAGNDATINLNAVFGGGSDPLTFDASLGTVGTDNTLTIGDSEFTEGVHTIIITATDANGDTVEETVDLTSDKTPTVDTAIDDIAVAGNGKHSGLIALADAFDGGTGNITLSVAAEQGTIDSNNMLDVSSVDLVNGANVIVVTATDEDNDKVTMGITINANKSPTLIATIQDAAVGDSFSSPGADIVFDLTTVFDGGGAALTYGTSLGSISEGKLTIAFSTLKEGVNTIVVNALDGDNEAVSDEFVLTKSSLEVSGLIDTTNLGAYGFIIQGDKGDDNLGYSVSAAGDVNNDGYADLIVGARYGHDGGDDAGEAYVIWGQANTAYGALVNDRHVLDTSTLGNAGFIIQGDAAGDGLGWSVSTAGDVNGDGYDDLIVGARDGDDADPGAGEAYVIWGKSGATRSDIDTTSLAISAGFIIRGDAEDDRLGISVAAAGDINSDGYADLIVGADYGDDGDTWAGEAYVIWGQANTTDGTLIGGRLVVDTTTIGTAGNPGFTGFIIQGDAEFDYLGTSVAAAGDVNGDGYADLIVGAPGSDSNTGEAYVIWGQASKEYGSLANDGRRVLDVTNLGTAGFIIQGNAGNQFGNSVSAAGDVDGDGFDDLIVGAPGGDSGGNNAGEAYVIWGKTGKSTSVVDTANLGNNGFIIQGDGASDFLGWSVSTAGDVNGDGYADLIVGARHGDDGGSNAGEAYVIWGQASKQYGNLVNNQWVVDTTNLDDDEGFIIQGDQGEDELGISVSAAGDVNGDGYDDLIVGARYGDNGGGNAGEAYVIWGGAHLSEYRLGHAGAANQPKREFYKAEETSDYHFDFSDLFINGKGELTLSYDDTETDSGNVATAGAGRWNASTERLIIDDSVVDEDFDIIITATDEDGDTAIWRIEVFDD